MSGGFSNLAARMLDTCIAALGTTGYYVRGAERTAVPGIFDANYVEVDPMTNMPVMSLGPAFSMKAANIPGGAWQEGDEVVVNDTAYEIIEPKPDSEGGVRLVLQKVTS